MASDEPLPPMDHTGGWKGSQYHPAIGREICRRIFEGQTVRQVVADPAMPSYATLFHWLRLHPDFARLYGAVRDALASDRAERRVLSTAHWRRVRAHERALAGKPPRDWVSGRRTSYRRDWAAAYCARIARGQSGMAVSAEPGMPSAKCVYRWLKDIPEFREMYVAARRRQRRELEIKVEIAVDEVERIGLAEAKARVARLEGRMGRLAPKTWRRVPTGRPVAGVAMRRPK